MLEIIKSGTQINFTSKFGFTSIFSLLLVITALVLTFSKMKYGVDFRGGAEVQVKFQKEINLADLRNSMRKAGFSGVTVQSIGQQSENEYLLKVPANQKNLNEVTDKLGVTLKKEFESVGVEIRKVDIVGPKAGQQLRVSGFQAMGWALIVIMIYVGLRFDFKYAPGAIVALFHDVAIILGFYSLTGTEFTLQTVAALLAVIGYSVNDTVVVYDRVREHEQKYAGLDLKIHINNAINETLSRTILTSGTTLFIAVSMLVIGGAAIHDFFVAMTIGIVVGTYSSVFVAAPATLFFNKISSKK
ncbi:MAG: protein translocase subunit SecF [Bacteriovoracaceae bacterium]|nr:protein translocase subunit SecF [Bacteriovoracaceae bacterium]